MYIYTDMIRSIVKISLLLLLMFIPQAQAHVYEVTFLGIPVVYVQLYETGLNHETTVSFQYRAETTALFSKIFLVQNTYRLTMDSDLRGILAFEKNIVQKNIRQNLKTEYSKERISYSNGDQRLAEGRVHNMLSLIIALTKEKDAVPKYYPLEIEGEFFDAAVIPIYQDSETIRWEIKTEKRSGRPVMQETDLFTSRLGDPSAFRSITVNTRSQMIVEAHFSLSRYKLSAKLVEEKP